MTKHLLRGVATKGIIPKLFLFRRDNLVYPHWGNIKIHCPLSYPLRSLLFCIVYIIPELCIVFGITKTENLITKTFLNKQGGQNP